jgi:hypothetical protein
MEYQKKSFFIDGKPFAEDDFQKTAPTKTISPRPIRP